MAGRPQYNPRGSVGGGSLMDATVGSRAMGTDSVGLTAAVTSIERRVQSVGLGRVTVAQSFPVFVTPASGAQITAVKVTLGTLMGHPANSNKAWTFNISNTTRNLCLSKYGATMSGVTLKATAFRTISLNGGNSTLNANDVLKLRASVSGSPDPIPNLMVHLEWTPSTVS